MNADVEFHIRQNYQWAKLPSNIKQILGNSQREYDKCVVNFSIKNQLRYKGSLVRYVKKDEKRYYEEVLQYSREHLMLYPYHLSDVMVKGLRITPFQYYIGIMQDIMTQEKSYDALPNFTAADCLRLLGIGRNRYIDLMNRCRSSKKFFRRKSVRDLLPLKPAGDVIIEPWWIMQAGYVTEDDIKMCSFPEKTVIDKIIDLGPQRAGDLDYKVVLSLYMKGLIYLDVPIQDDDCFVVPPLEGFVMNRVLGDYFETLLYKIFVSIDEHTTVSELANVLQIDLQLVKNAVSMYCRLGFARRKIQEIDMVDLHSSWKNVSTPSKKAQHESLLIDWSHAIDKTSSTDNSGVASPETSSIDEQDPSSLMGSGHSKRIAFLFDSTLTAFLMMGNLSPGLKSHAVTMFEVGKLSDESLDSFLAELEKVNSVAEGEAQRYFDHAITLRNTIIFLRYNKDLNPFNDCHSVGLGIDLLRCESLLGLEPATCSRVLNKNYTLLVSMAPLSNEIRPVSSCMPQHIGPAIPEVNSVWFKLFIYNLTKCGPPTLLLVKGTKLRKLPWIFQDYERLLVTTWGHDPGVVPTSNVLLTLNDALSHSAVLLQAHGWTSDGETIFVPFPLDEKCNKDDTSWSKHTAVRELASLIDLQHTCGYITLLKTNKPNPVNISTEKLHISDSDLYPTNGIKDSASAEMLVSELDSLDINDSNRISPRTSVDRKLLKLDFSNSQRNCKKDVESDWVLLDCCFGIPLFDSTLNKEVCKRIISQGLCNQDSLQELLHSSRKLSLRLLNFIAQNQDLPIRPDDNGPFSGWKSNNEPAVVYPTHNLMFYNGTLQAWNRH